ncbi:hypothetical protein M3J09_010073 [Ascochyta lentis]
MYGVVSLDLDRRPTQPENVRTRGDAEHLSRAQLRGDSGQRQVGFLGWFKKSRMNKKPDKCRGKKNDSAVTYKGKKIGPPQPTSALNVLPPASRYVQLHKDRTSFDRAPRPPLEDGYHVNSNHLPTSHWQDYYIPERTTTPLPPAVPAVTITRLRPVTMNPFANIYGNPNITRATPTHPPINYAAAGSLIYRPSALDGSQTGYDHVRAEPKKDALRSSFEAAAENVKYEKLDVKPTVQKMRAERKWDDRKWDKLPALPPGESASEAVVENDRPVETDTKDDGFFDTEEILRSLRPERLSMYHISIPRRPVNYLHQPLTECT